MWWCARLGICDPASKQRTLTLVWYPAMAGHLFLSTPTPPERAAAMNPICKKNFVRQCLRLAGVPYCWGLAQPVWAGLTVNGNGTVNRQHHQPGMGTNAPWVNGRRLQHGHGFYGTWAGALDAAVAANAASYKGLHRLACTQQNELESITKIDSYTSGQPSIDTTAFPNTPLNWFWTSTTYSPIPSGAWFVDFHRRRRRRQRQRRVPTVFASCEADSLCCF